jgi:hypothetical protein
MNRRMWTMNRKIGAVALWIFAPTGCAAPAPDSGELDRQAVEAEIAGFADAFWDAWRDGNSGLDRAMSFFDDGPGFSYAAQGTVWRSVSDVTAAFRSAFEVVRSQTIEIQETEITVLGEDAAHLMQRGAYSMTDTNGETSEMSPLVFTGLLIRTDSGWRVRSAHVSEPCAG